MINPTHDGERSEFRRLCSVCNSRGPHSKADCITKRFYLEFDSAMDAMQEQEDDFSWISPHDTEGMEA